MNQRFKDHIDTNFPFLYRRKLLLAISGGLDSVVLNDLLVKNNFDVSLAHCNFQLRGSDSDKDETFVKELATKYQIPLFAVKFDTINYAAKQKISTQVAARELRYNWFEKVRKEHRLDFILTAHHADDNVETVLINLIRGTGLEGLTGIPERNKNIIRPLLPFTRAMVETYARKNNLNWREDLSNQQDKYTRNKIRHQIIPLLKDLNPGFDNSFIETISHLKGASAIVKESVKKVQCITFQKTGKNSYQIDIQKLKKQKHFREYLYEILKDYGFTSWDDVFHLLEAQPGKQVFSKKYRLVKDRHYLLLGKLPAEEQKNEFLIKNGQKKIKTDEFELLLRDVELKDSDRQHIFKNLSAHVAYLDKSNIKFPLTVRKWQNGDYFYPIGLNGKKKLSKYFKDEKISVIEKENIWLLCDRSKIIWVIGKRIDDRFKVTDKTKEILKIEYKS